MFLVRQAAQDHDAQEQVTGIGRMVDWPERPGRCPGTFSAVPTGLIFSAPIYPGRCPGLLSAVPAGLVRSA